MIFPFGHNLTRRINNAAHKFKVSHCIEWSTFFFIFSLLLVVSSLSSDIWKGSAEYLRKRKNTGEQCLSRHYFFYCALSFRYRTNLGAELSCSCFWRSHGLWRIKIFTIYGVLSVILQQHLNTNTKFFFECLLLSLSWSVCPLSHTKTKECQPRLD